MSKISFISSENRKYNVERVLSLIKSEIIAGLKDAKKVVVKPNCCVESCKEACTHVDALDAVFEFIKPYTTEQIILAEGTGIGKTLNAFKNYGYLTLQEKYDFAIIDLNDDDYEEIELKDSKGKSQTFRIAKTITSADYLISVALPKTHDSVVYTGAIKNIAVGSLVQSSENIASKLVGKFGLSSNFKAALHQTKNLNQNIAELYKKYPPHLAIIDGYEIMQGNGPVKGNIMPANFAIASSDPVAADWLTTQLMKIEIHDIGYLSILEAEKKTDSFVVGDDWIQHIRQYKMHDNYAKAKKWQ